MESAYISLYLIVSLFWSHLMLTLLSLHCPQKRNSAYEEDYIIYISYSRVWTLNKKIKTNLKCSTFLNVLIRVKKHPLLAEWLTNNCWYDWRLWCTWWTQWARKYHRFQIFIVLSAPSLYFLNIWWQVSKSPYFFSLGISEYTKAMEPCGPNLTSYSRVNQLRYLESVRTNKHNYFLTKHKSSITH